jgi:2,3-bisphosphoglycerate-independent phosphoglycerate mutase
MNSRKKVVVVITDGVGIAPHNPGNAVTQAHTPTFDHHWGPDPFNTSFHGDDFCSMRLIAHGQHVGLPNGVMGNSEVGHSAIFSGKPYYELLDDITVGLGDGRIYSSPAWHKMVARKEHTTHFLGLLSNGQVHSDISHLLVMMWECAKQGIKKVRVWALTDGRDVAPASAQFFVSQLQQICDKINVNFNADYKIAMIAGRASTLMDRGEDDWKRVEKAWNALFFADGQLAQDPLSAIDQMREELAGQKFTDEHLGLRLISEADGEAPRVCAGDNLLLFNYRTDRAVEFCSWMLGQPLTASALKQNASRRERPEDVLFVTMTDFDPDTMPLKDFLLPKIKIDTTLVQFLGTKGAKIFCTSEPSKFPHVTEFPNARSKQCPEHCVWHKVHSDQKPPFNRLPMMQSVNIALSATQAMKSGDYDLLILNFPSPDMVGHETSLEAAISAVEAADYGMAEILRVAKETGYTVVYGGDHGNAERMYVYEDGQVEYDDKQQPVWHTAHTCNPVRWVIYDPSGAPKLNENTSEPSLGNLSATIANLLGYTDLPAHWLPSLLG